MMTICFDVIQGQAVISCPKTGKALSFKAYRLYEIAQKAISCVPKSSRYAWERAFLKFWETHKFLSSGYTIKGFKPDLIILGLEDQEVEIPINWVELYNSTEDGYFLTETTEEVSDRINMAVTCHDLFWQGYSEEDILNGRFDLIDHCMEYA